MEKMIQQLADVLEGKKYVLIGGIAVDIQGRQRYTHDADIVITISENELPDLIDKLKEHGFTMSESYREKFTEKLISQQAAKIMYDKYFSVDLRIASYSIDKEAIKRATPVTIFGKKYSVATAEDIIVYKIARFSDQDRADIQGIIERHGKKLDTTYIKQATEQLISETGRNYMHEYLKEASSWIINGLPIKQSQEQKHKIEHTHRRGRHL